MLVTTVARPWGGAGRACDKPDPGYVRAGLRNIAMTTNEVNRMKPKRFVDRPAWQILLLYAALGVVGALAIIAAVAS